MSTITHLWEKPHTHSSNHINDLCAICGEDLRHPIHAKRVLRLFAIKAHDGSNDPDGPMAHYIVAETDADAALKRVETYCREQWDWDNYVFKAHEIDPVTRPGIIWEIE